MSKLYWRVKRDGKWTWRSAKLCPLYPELIPRYVVLPLEDEEE